MDFQEVLPGLVYPKTAVSYTFVLQIRPPAHDDLARVKHNTIQNPALPADA